MANLCILIAGVNLRADPSTTSQLLLTTTAPRNYATVVGKAAPTDGSGFPWLEIRGDNGLEAWVRADVVWRVIGDLRLLGSMAYDAPVAGLEAFPPVGVGIPPRMPQEAPQPPSGALAKWPAPLAGYTITEPFGGPSGHLGIDLAVPVGTAIFSRGAGVVYSADDCPGCPAGNGAIHGTTDPRTNFGFGINVVIRYRYEDVPAVTQRALDAADAEFLFVRFAHLSKRFVLAGMTVKAGDLLGWSGTSGNSTGPHCHLEIRASANERPVSVFAEKLLDPNLLFAL